MLNSQTQIKHHSNLIAGAWKFNHSAKVDKYAVSTEDLAKTAVEMVKAKLSKGRFLEVFIRGTGHNEIGICFTYEATEDEMETKDDKEDMSKETRTAYVNFFYLRHGVAFKGYDIGTGIHVINLTS